MNINLYAAHIRQADMLREAEQARLAQTALSGSHDHRRPFPSLKLPIRVQWKRVPQPIPARLDDCPSPCV